jgi:hypothetical protein
MSPSHRRLLMLMVYVFCDSSVIAAPPYSGMLFIVYSETGFRRAKLPINQMAINILQQGRAFVNQPAC